jgi:hypothetical protein
MPSLRSCSVGPPRWAIHGPTRLNRHPCRFTHYAEPERSLTMGQENQKPKQRQKRGELTLDLVVRWYASPVGAGLPAKVVNDDAGILTPRGALRFFASKLAPTSVSLALALDLDLFAPFPGADGGGPTEQCLRYGTPSLSEGPNGGARLFGSFCLGRHSGRLTKGTRRKGETISGRYRRNGYVLGQ